MKLLFVLLPIVLLEQSQALPSSATLAKAGKAAVKFIIKGKKVYDRFGGDHQEEQDGGDEPSSSFSPTISPSLDPVELGSYLQAFCSNLTENGTGDDDGYDDDDGYYNEDYRCGNCTVQGDSFSYTCYNPTEQCFEDLGECDHITEDYIFRDLTSANSTLDYIMCFNDTQGQSDIQCLGYTYCSDNDTYCGCFITIGNTECSSCELCTDDLNSTEFGLISYDCTNVLGYDNVTDSQCTVDANNNSATTIDDDRSDANNDATTTTTDGGPGVANNDDDGATTTNGDGGGGTDDSSGSSGSDSGSSSTSANGSTSSATVWSSKLWAFTVVVLLCNIV